MILQIGLSSGFPNPATRSAQAMKNIGKYHDLLTELDHRIDQIAELRKKRKQRLFALLAQVENRFHRNQQELTGARAHIRELESIIHGLNDRLAHVVGEVAREAQSTDELCARITEIDRALNALTAKPKSAVPSPAGDLARDRPGTGKGGSRTTGSQDGEDWKAGGNGVRKEGGRATGGARAEPGRETGRRQSASRRGASAFAQGRAHRNRGAGARRAGLPARRSL